MTDPTAPLTDDELSSVLDGEAAPEVLSRLDADPAAQQRYRELESARRLVSDTPVVALPSSVVDDLVSRAMAEVGAASAGPTDDTVTPLVAPPRATARRIPPPWAMAAVVAVLVAIGLGLVWSGQNSDDTSNAELAGAGSTEANADRDAGTDSADDAPPQDAGSATDEQEPSYTPEQGVPAPLIDLGEFATRAKLRTSLVDGVTSKGDLTDPDVAPTTAEIQRCDTQLAALLQGEGIGSAADREAFAVVDGDPYVVYEFELTEPDEGLTSLISAVDPTSCDPLITFVR
jgi:hypothetical protein